MKRTEQHIIDSEAQLILKSFIPSSWVLREQDQDYGIDSEIEVFNNNLSTGIIFKVQLKGSRGFKLINQDTTISFQISVEHVKYYLDEITIPTFFVLVDITSKEIFWANLLLDVDLKEKFNQKSETNDEFLQLHIPVLNILNKTDIFLEEYLKSQAYLSTRILKNIGNSDFSKIISSITNKQDSIKALLEKADLIRIYEISNLINDQKFTEADENIAVILESKQSKIEFKFEALLNKERIDVILSDLEQEKSEDILNIHLKYSKILYGYVKKGPLHLKAYAIFAYHTAILEKMVKDEYGLYMNWKLHKEKIDILWFSQLSTNRLILINKIVRKFNQLKRFLGFLIRINILNIIPALFIRLIESFCIFIIRLRIEELKDAFKYYKSIVIDLSRVSFQIATILDQEEDQSHIACSIIIMSDIHNKEEFKQEDELVLSMISQIKNVDRKNNTLEHYKNIKNNLVKSTQIKYDPLEITTEQEIKIYTTMAKSLGIDLDDDTNQITKIVKIGLKDLNPERILKNCKHLFTFCTGGGYPAQILKMPTAGSKRVICTAKEKQIESLSLDNAYSGMEKEYCKGCTLKLPHDKNWKWTREWQISEDIKNEKYFR